MSPMALAERLGARDNSWSVACSAFCHVKLLFAIMQLCNFEKVVIVSVHLFIVHLKINLADRLTLPACPKPLMIF